MEAMHGYPSGFYDRVKANVSEGAYCGMMGNAVSLAPLMRLLPQALYTAGLIRGAPPCYWQRAVLEAIGAGTAVPLVQSGRVAKRPAAAKPA